MKKVCIWLRINYCLSLLSDDSFTVRVFTIYRCVFNMFIKLCLGNSLHFPCVSYIFYAQYNGNGRFCVTFFTWMDDRRHYATFTRRKRTSRLWNWTFKLSCVENTCDILRITGIAVSLLNLERWLSPSFNIRVSIKTWASVIIVQFQLM